MSKIFVFGSNTLGRHGKGAALDARNKYGAQYGVGEGPTGHAYAIPTKSGTLKTLSLDDIKISVEGFKKYAAENPQKEFFVTRIGCGLAGYKDDDIGPMFHDAPDNCELPPQWIQFKDSEKEVLDR